MGRNIVICCDGTANEFAQNRTNVVKLYYTLEHDPDRQTAFYHPGLGTMEPAGALSTLSRRITRGLGMAFGYGLSDDIRDAYVFLMDYFREGDSVYLFGFSRGAYTARATCSLLRMYGLIRSGNVPLVPYAIRMMMAIEKLSGAKRSAKQDADLERYFQLAEDFKRMMCHADCKPHFVGVWDTVSSVGWKENPLKLPFIADNPDINIGRHAIALDERRAFFRTNRWIPSTVLKEHGPKDLKQVWFPGVHCDVGGGYPESESGLSKITFQWMLEEAEAAGLLVNKSRKSEVLGETGSTEYVKPDPNAVGHESLQGMWKIAEWVRKPHYDWKTGKTERRSNRGRRRIVPADALVHDSVYLRHGGKYVENLHLPDGVKRVRSLQWTEEGEPRTFSET
jgi:uncharacterized protein (DUF2235 family)